MEPPDLSVSDADSTTAKLPMVKFESSDHCSNLLKNLDRLRQSGEQCDVTLKTEGKLFPCHKAVLIGGCEYFRAMFASNMKESQSNQVELLDIHPDVLEYILQYLYTGSITLDSSSVAASDSLTDVVKALLQTADLFQLPAPLRDQCERHLQRAVATANCLALHYFADMHSLEVLKTTTGELMLERFIEICQHDDFLLLDVNQLKEYVRNDRLNAPNEDPVYSAVRRWLRHDWEQRQQHKVDLLGHVRFPLCSPQFFLDEIEHDPLMSDCDIFLREYKEFHMVPEKRDQMTCVNRRAQPRISQTQQRLVLIGGRDSNWKTLQSAWYLDQTRQQWVRLCDVPFDNFQFSVCCVNNRAYVTGGYRIPHGATADVWEYSGYSQRWTRKADMSVAREDHGSVACGGAIYVTGGTSSSRLVLTHVERYDPETDEWRPGPELLRAVYQPAVAAIATSVYVIGGTTYAEREMRYVTCMGIQVLDVTTQQWTNLTSTMFRISGGCAAVLGTRIFLSCGYDKLLCSFDTASTKWEYHSIAPTGHARGRAVAASGKVWLIAGKYKAKDARYDWTASIDVYDPATKTWATLHPPCTQPMTDFGAVLLNIAL